MYCPHCGTETTPGLNYCNRCGGNLGMLTTNAAQGSQPVVSTGKVWAIGTTTMLLIVMGLGMLFAAISDQMNKGLPPDVLKLLIAGSIMTILAGVAFLGWLWTRILALPRRSDHSAAPRMHARSAPTNELGSARISALPDAHTIPAASITEHTTRTLEHAKK
jgi:hypothetical protein